MINRLHSVFFRPENGWDPVPAAHAERYAEGEWRAIDTTLVDRLETWLDGFAGKRVLDLGGGPGQYSVGFAVRGADVTWHDVSRRYLDIARAHARARRVAVEFSLGYMEEARRFLDRPFDLVFSRIAWSYCMSDAPFSRLVYGLVKPGGVGYVDTNTPAFVRDMSLRLRTVHWLNAALRIKVGHPYPPHGRIAHLFCRLPMERIEIDYARATNDRVLFRKARAEP